jgi:hypothetical protein
MWQIQLLSGQTRGDLAYLAVAVSFLNAEIHFQKAACDIKRKINLGESMNMTKNREAHKNETVV